MASSGYSVTSILARHGPALTSDVAARLREAGRSAVAARQSVSRLPGNVRVLRGLSFPKRARFIYLDDQFGTNRYWDVLISAGEKASPAYAAGLAGLRSRGGVVPSRHFDIAAGAPVKQKGQISGQVVLERLAAVGLVTRTEVQGIGECAMLAAEGALGTPMLAGLRARLLTEGVLLDAIRTWAGRMNMASARKVRIRDEEPAPQFSTCRFDLCGPSYLHPLVRWQAAKPSPGFLVADVVLGQALEEADVQPLLRKCRTLSQLRKVRPFLPMLIADGFSSEALRACRAQGVIATRPDTLFGQDVARALADLLEVLTNAGAMAAAQPQRIESLFQRLSAVEGAAGNLRGALFELLVGHMICSVEGGSIDIGVLVEDTSASPRRRAEVDVRLVKEREVRIYECKGYQPSAVVREEEINDWLKRCVPTINDAHRQEPRFNGSALHFEFWTCGSFDDDALSLLRDAQGRTRKYSINWKSGGEVREYAKRIKAQGIRKILNEHYYDHPLSGLPNALPSRPEALAKVVTEQPYPEGWDEDNFEDAEA